MDMRTRRIRICNIAIDNVDFREAIERIDSLVKQNTGAYVLTPNVDHLVKLKDDLFFQEIYERADLVVPDGMPLLWISRFLKMPLKEKVSGSDLVPFLCEMARDKGYRLFFLGGREGAALAAKEKLESRFPGIQIVGTYCPSFGFENELEENRTLMRIIKEAQPHVLLVGLGAPKQEKWIYKYYRETGVPVSIGVGVTFEFISGMIKRAPLWMQRVGLEWFWRLIKEPRRLWKRYLIDDPTFFWLVLKQKFSQKKDND
jgi:N-acetylglucosaminyldiphosphoundecaprenol N-acetyl-beta-D-mannosaminyltransferase